MSKCIFCSESAGLLSSEHKSCRDRANQELEKGRARLDQAILEGRPSKDVIAALKSYRVAGRLDPSINLQKEWLVQADRTALLRSEYKPIDNQAFQEIADLYVYLKPDLLQLGAKMVNWPGYVSLSHSNTIYQVLMGETPYMPPGADAGFSLARDENLITRRNAQLAEYRSSTQRSSYQSVSLPVGGGIYYRLGVSTPTLSRTSLDVVDEGTIALTDHAVYFGGNLSTFRIGYDEILRLDPYKDGFGVHGRHGSGKVIIPASLGFNDGWYWYALVSAFVDRIRP